MHLSTVLPGSSFSLLNFPSKPTQISTIAKSQFGFSNSTLKTKNTAKTRCSCQLKDSYSDKEEGEETEREGRKGKAKKAFPWKSVFLGETTNSKNSNGSKKNKLKGKSDYTDDSGSYDWCVQARKLALKSIEARGFSHKLERMVTPKKKRKKKRKANKEKYGKLDTRGIDRILDKLESDQEEEEEDEEGFTIDLSDDQNPLKDQVTHFADGFFEEKRARAKAAFVEKLSKFAGPSDRKKEISLNKQIIHAESAQEVLEVISDIVTAVAKGLSPSPLSPLNIATALHRIAKNMERVKMVEPSRLGFARQKETALLVGISMIALPDCNSQGISNIAWALSKIGGDLLYSSEMDRIADVAVTKINEFNAQNVANVAGAFASMRHASEDLFIKLVFRAGEIVETFNEKEITQFLWACATLNADAGPFLDALDECFSFRVGLLHNNEFENEDENENEISESENDIETESEDEDEDFENVDEIDDLESLDELDDIFDDYKNLGDSKYLDELKSLNGLKSLDDLKGLDDFLETSSNTEQQQDFALNFTRDQIGNLAWSYAVLGQTGRPFFSTIWNILSKFKRQRISDQYREDVLFANQVYIANQCLKIENPNLGLALSGGLEERIYRVGKTKRFNMKISSLFQKEVGRVLVSTGLDFVREYEIDGYTVDAALVDQKLAFEMDGPTHFSRNLGTPLGHTMMKRRYITAAGWKLVTLSYQEWQALQYEADQLEYLRKLLGIDEERNLEEINQDESESESESGSESESECESDIESL
ncbi:hypothetical protein LUZ60_013418 [Juncus effusus]|nr:hypothetical protein LUZ60_013418 [Juncus effusus]